MRHRIHGFPSRGKIGQMCRLKESQSRQVESHLSMHPAVFWPQLSGHAHCPRAEVMASHVPSQCTSPLNKWRDLQKVLRCQARAPRHTGWMNTSLIFPSKITDLSRIRRYRWPTDATQSLSDVCLQGTEVCTLLQPHRRAEIPLNTLNANA